MRKWFGESWGAQVCEPEAHTETPVGAGCLHCGEPIAEGDRGFLDEGAGVTHFECGLRMIIGGANHLRGTCSCCGGDQPPDPPELTTRQAAVLAVKVWNEGYDQ